MADRRSKLKERSKELQRGASDKALRSPLTLTVDESGTCHCMGHEFKKKTYFQPTYCQHCTDLLWGIKGQGYQCTVCNFITHEKCMAHVKVPCLHIIAQSIHDPVAHQWTKPTSFKKKVFCNFCRKRINSLGCICEVCKYYTHLRCQPHAFNNCKKVATYAKGREVDDKHHLIEGNLPGSAKCSVCFKTCSSTDCLTGFRCGWCGLAVHSACMDEFNIQSNCCTFRDLWHMILPPHVISHRSSLRSKCTPAETPITGDLITPVEEDDEELLADVGEGEGEKQEDYGEKGRPCIVVDGRGKKAFKKWRNTTLHPTYITKATKASELLAISLKKLGINDSIEDYFLVDATSKEGVERELLHSEQPFFIKKDGFGPLKLYLRSRTLESSKGQLRIYNGQLDLTSIAGITLSVTNSTTAEEVVRSALIQFELEDVEADLYCLVEVSQIVKEGVSERVLNGWELPWKQITDLRKESLKSGYHHRYFLRHKEGFETDVYLWDLPKQEEGGVDDKSWCLSHLKTLLKDAPRHMLPDAIPYERIEIGPFFPSHGGVILHFPTFDLAMKISAALDEVRPGKIMIIPTIHAEEVAENQEPLLVFVNRKSGGNQGKELLSAFRRHINPHQVFDILNGGPIPGLYAFRKLPHFRILIGGGDGTFGWVLGAVEDMKKYLLCSDVPCGLVPLGTGNDLARALKWGGGYTGEKIMQVLLSMEDANVVELDRWEVTFTDTDGKKSTLLMYNYFGLGLDAAIALDFHNAREENPEKFNSRFRNKGMYLQLGLQQMVTKQTVDLDKDINIFIDDKVIKLPDVKGIIFLNIQSWGSGADLWGSGSDPNYKPASFNDGLLEVAGLSGVMQMGQVQSGIRHGIRIAQGHKFKVEILAAGVPVQVDGEAWPCPVGSFTFQLLPSKAMMLQKAEKYFATKQSRDSLKIVSYSKQLSNPELLLEGGLSSRRRPARTSQDNSGLQQSLLGEEEEDEEGQ